MEYGSGAIFGCPAHDQRDLEFALKYNLDVVPVVCPHNQDAANFMIEKCYYMLSTLYSLDQEDTNTAIEKLQIFPYSFKIL